MFYSCSKHNYTGWNVSCPSCLIEISEASRVMIEKSESLKNLHAELLPLGKNKYYGSVISVTGPDNGEQRFDLWFTDKTHTPSDRYLETYGYTRDQWDKNELVDNGWGGQSPIREIDMTCDSHYETQFCYDMCMFIVNCINGDNI